MTPGPQFEKNNRFSRRHALGMAAAGGAALALSACGSSSSGPSSASVATVGKTDPASFKGETLNLFTWASYHENAWLKEYEQLRGVTIKKQLFGSVSDGFAKVQADPEGFDLVLATSGWVENYADAGLIVPPDQSAVPNMKNILTELPWRDATEYKGQNWAIIYNWGDEPICWLPGKTPTPKVAWKSLYDPAYTGKVSLVDDPTTIMPFIPIMLGYPDPYDLDEKQMEGMKKALTELRPQVTHLSASIEDQTNDFANGDVTMGILYNISTQTALRDNGIKMTQKLPPEGVPTWSDNYVMTKAGAKKAALCYDFINYTLTVPWQARFAAESSNTGILPLKLAESKEAVEAGLNEQALNATLLPYTAEGKPFFSKLALNKRVPNLEEWLELWNEFKISL
ncbi:MAG: extracellular solute-binding protein [Actinobacteria bacterium]|nr:extracellular solute-binding protein [Actinomycetota bacterium]